MSDNVAFTPGVGGSLATDDLGGVQYQRVKVTWGTDGVANDANATTPLPVALTGIVAATPLQITSGLKTSEQLTRAVISFASSGDNSVVAASASNFFRLYALLLTVDSPVSVKLGQTGPTYWTGAMKFWGGGGLLLTQQGEPHFISDAINKAFLINLSAAVQCSGVVWYTLAP